MRISLQFCICTKNSEFQLSLNKVPFSTCQRFTHEIIFPCKIQLRKRILSFFITLFKKSILCPKIHFLKNIKLFEFSCQKSRIWPKIWIWKIQNNLIEFLDRKRWFVTVCTYIGSNYIRIFNQRIHTFVH